MILFLNKAFCDIRYSMKQFVALYYQYNPVVENRRLQNQHHQHPQLEQMDHLKTGKQFLKIWFTGVFMTLILSTSAYGFSIITLGDSITSGLKRNAGGTVLYCPPDNVTTSGFYVCNGDDVKNIGGYQAAAKSQLASIGATADLYNWGFAGERSTDMVNRVTQAINGRPATYVFFMAGTNDLGIFSVGTTFFNLTVVLQSIIDAGLTPVVGTITPRFDNGAFDASIQIINDALVDYAEENNIAVADHYSAMIGNFGAYQSGDQLHINSTGDAVMAVEWRKGYEAAELLAQQANAGRTLPGIITILLE